MITHQLPPTEHNILSDVWAVSFSLVVTSDALRLLLSFRHPYPYFKWIWKDEGGQKGLVQIQNSINPMAWVHEAVLWRRRMVFGGLAPVQVVFI